MGKFLHVYNQPKLKQEDINHVSRLIISNESKAIIKILPTKNSPGTDGFMVKFYQNIKEKLIVILLKLFQEMEREGTLPDSFYEAGITLI
jgi:hypothetical protein